MAVSDLLTSSTTVLPAQPMKGPVTPRELAAMARRQRQKKAAQLEVDTALTNTARSWHAGDDEKKPTAVDSQSPAHTQPASRPRSPAAAAQTPDSGSHGDTFTVNGAAANGAATADNSGLIDSTLVVQLQDEKQKSSWLEKQLRKAQETARQHEETARHHEERARLAEDTVRGLTSQPTSSCPSPEPQLAQPQAPAQPQPIQPQAPAQAQGAHLGADWYSSADNNKLADIIDGTSAINQVVNQHRPFQQPAEPLQLPSVSGLLASGRKVYVSPRSWAQPRTNHRRRSAPVNQPDHAAKHTFVPPAQHQLNPERTTSDLSAPTESVGGDMRSVGGDMRRPLGYSSRVLARCERLQQVYEKYGCSSAQAVALSRPGAKAPAAAREARGAPAAAREARG